MLPIIVMTRNEGKLLYTCINSLKKIINIEHHIYVVDNHSDCNEHLEVLRQLELIEDITIIRNRTNLWVLGINKILEKIKQLYPKEKYFMLTDGDIDFSPLREDSFIEVIKKMDSNVSIGKIGFSLSWDNIKNNPKFINIYRQELSLYDENKKIDDYYVSPVDTTAAIIRFDWSLEQNGLFYPDHIRYLRPELYSCRTPRKTVVKHLGWDTYFSVSSNRKQIDDKVFCFTLASGFIKEEILKQATFRIRLFNLIFARPIYIFWILRRYYYLFSYVLRKGRKIFDNQ